jgi:sugar lactone lactonase YvrE
MSRRLFSGVLLAATWLVCAVGVIAGAPGFWQAATQADFLRGEVDQLSIDEHGRLTLGPELQRVHDGGVPFIWTLLPAPDGSVFLGTGNDGKVIRVDRAGTGTVFYDSSELEVHALANAPNGQLYVGTSPDGRIYRIDAQGRAETFFDPDDKYIWSIAVDRQGVVFAATGDKGIVYRITPDGKSTRFFATKAAHAVSLTFDANGQLLVGTGSPGRVFRVDTTGKGFLLLDTSYQEIHSIRVDAKGVIFAAAQSGRQAQQSDSPAEIVAPPPPTPAIPNVSTEITSIAVIDVPVASSSSQSGGPARDDRKPTGAVYRVQPDGLWDELWTSREDAPYDLSLESDGSVLIATGPKGKLFRLSGNPMRALLLTRVPSQQATMLARVAERTFVATANPGLLMSISSTRALRGTYESEVKDAQTVATWGVLAWRASSPTGAQVQLFTRSGNTRTPDEAWSDWSGPYQNANGSPITSPKARFLQWRAVLSAKSETPVLTSVTSAYLPRNVRPQVTSITVHPPGVVFQKPFSSGEAEIAGLDDDTPDRRNNSAGSNSGGSGGGGPQLGRRTFQHGLQTFVWRAEDDNGDELSYDVMYRREGETTWRPLKSGLKDTLYVWDTSSVPNGTYVLRVLASDAKSNPAEMALVGDLESGSFEIDTVAPVVSMGAVRKDGARFVISGDVRDTDSAVTRLEYSLDAQRWESAFARDGILDGRSESFEIRLDADAAGRTLVVRASDALGNVGTGQIVVR